MSAICIQVINPNTSLAMTETIGAAARAVAAPGTEILAVCPRAGVPSIEGHFDEAIAAVGVLEQIKAGREQGVDGHVIACFGDPGLLAARELAQGPVIGIAEAAMHMATMVATRFSIVTTLPRTLIIARHLLHQYGFHQHCAALHAIDLPVLALEDGSGLAQEKVRERCIRALKEDGSDCPWLRWHGDAGAGADPRAAGASDRWRQRGGEDGGVTGRAGPGDQQARGLSVPGEKSVKRTVSVVKSILKGAGDGREPGTLSSRSARLCRAATARALAGRGADRGAVRPQL